MDIHRGLSIGKSLYITTAELKAKDIADAFGQRPVGVPRQDTDA
jgi:hypothetical protein